ncbi:MAG: putative glycolipid-binding domain-containing protein [Solirubrobacteraceae bacterium]
MKDAPRGAEAARIELAPDRLSAKGVAIGSEPEPYRLDYELDTVADFVSRRVVVQTLGDGWSRRLELIRSPDGMWAQNISSRGGPDLPGPGGDLSELGEAADPDLGLSPLFNTMPVRRGRIHRGGATADFLMVWISVPDLSIHPSAQRYTHLETRSEDERVVRFQALADDGVDFAADVVFDAEGLVVDYPGIASRIRGS